MKHRGNEKNDAPRDFVYHERYKVFRNILFSYENQSVRVCYDAGLVDDMAKGERNTSYVND